METDTPRHILDYLKPSVSAGRVGAYFWASIALATVCLAAFIGCVYFNSEEFEAVTGAPSFLWQLPIRDAEILHMQRMKLGCTAMLMCSFPAFFVFWFRSRVVKRQRNRLESGEHLK